MLTSFRLKSLTSAGNIASTPITLLIGPNHGGKSLLLREMAARARRPHSQRIVEEFKILDDLGLVLPSFEETRQFIRTRMARQDGQDRSSPPTQFEHSDGRRTNVQGLLGYSDEQIRPNSDLLDQMAAFWTVAIDGAARLSMLDHTELGDTEEGAGRPLGILARRDEKRQLVRESIHQGLGEYFVLETLIGGFVGARLSPSAPPSSIVEQSYTTDARAFQGQAAKFRDWSDGRRAYCGLVASAVALEERLILVDEPEAFLHPPMARTLGSQLATLMAGSGRTMVAATHSSHFLEGCLSSGTPVTIVRLTYSKGAGRAWLLAAKDLEPWTRDPLLRSTGIFDALFCSGAVVVEADGDRVFYSEINHRLFVANDADRCSDTAFLRAHNRQTIGRVTHALRSMGVNAAAVVDLDVIEDRQFNELLKACNVPVSIQQALASLRVATASALKKVEPVPKKWRLASITNEQERAGADKLLADVAEYGLFVVPEGALESWLPDLAVASGKSAWLGSILERLGSDPSGPSYVGPRGDDVWAFLRSIARWIANPSRRGMV